MCGIINTIFSFPEIIQKSAYSAKDDFSITSRDWSQLHYFSWSYDHTHILQLLYRKSYFCTIFLHPLYKHIFATNDRRRMVGTSLERYYKALIENQHLVDPSMIISADLSILSALLGQKYPKWRHVTSRDATWSDFHLNLQTCFFTLYLACANIWSRLRMYHKGYGKFTFTYCSYGAPTNMRSPCLDKMSKTFFLGMELTQNHQETCKTKF